MIYTYVATAVAAALLAFGCAWQVQDWRYGAREADRQELVREARRGTIKSGDNAAAAHEADKAAIRTEFVTITETVEKIVEKPIYLNTCLDADGLRLLSAATRSSAAPGKPAGTVP